MEGGRLGGRVCAVHVKIGQLAGVAKEALAFSYEQATHHRKPPRSAPALPEEP